MQKCRAVSGFSEQCCGKFAVSLDLNCHVQEGYFLGGVLKSKQGYWLGGVLKFDLDCGVEVVHDALQGLKLVGSAQKNHEDVIYEPFPKEDCIDEDFSDGFFLGTHEKVGVWWRSFDTRGCAYQLEKMFIHE